jgi:hypothetical protein
MPDVPATRAELANLGASRVKSCVSWQAGRLLDLAAQEGGRVRFTVNGEQFELAEEDVRRELHDVRPEPPHQYAIQIGSALYPVKQAFEVVTGVPRSAFTTQVARRVFAAMGFDVVGGSGQLRAEEMTVRIAATRRRHDLLRPRRRH